VFGLFDNGSGLADADEKYWSAFLPERRQIIRMTIERVRAADIERAQKDRMVAALKAAVGRSHLITPQLCVEYLQAWQEDCVRWRKHILELRRNHSGSLGIEDALTTLGIGHLVQPGVDGRISTTARRRSATRPLVRA
jgi:hypothetical protein